MTREDVPANEQVSKQVNKQQSAQQKDSLEPQQAKTGSDNLQKSGAKKPIAKNTSRKKQPPALVPVLISSRGIETTPETIRDEETGQVRIDHFLYGAINGHSFKVLCNRQTEVEPDIAEVLQGIILQQQERLQKGQGGT